MESEVYADLLFLVNFSMDFLSFYLCARLLHRPLSLWRAVLASVAGGVYAVAVLFLTVGKIPAFAIDALVCVALCALCMAGRRERWSSLLRLSGLYLLISMLLGGAMTLLYSQLNRVPGLTDRVSEEGLSTWVFLGLAMVSGVLTTLWGRCFKRATTRRPVAVVVQENGRRAVIPGLCDSGNLLREPISGRLVVPVEGSRLQGVLPEALLRAAASERVSEAVEGLPVDVARRVRLIPARGAVGERMLLGFAPEHVYLQEGDEQVEVTVLIAPTGLADKADGIAALVPAELMMT